MKLITLFFIIIFSSACSISLLTTKSTARPAADPIQKVTPTPASSQLVAVTPATAEQCPTGGNVFSIYFDVNNNKLQDSEELSESTYFVCNGFNGSNGADGSNGSNGHSMQFAVTSASSEMCPAGGSILAMALDVTDRGSYSIADPNQQTMVICNGLQGASATVSGYTPAEVIQPCGNSSSYEEVLLRLSNGQVLAAFSENVNGLNTRLSLIPDGTYMTSDGTSCVFTLSTNGNTRSVSWSNQIQNTWSITY